MNQSFGVVILLIFLTSHLPTFFNQKRGFISYGDSAKWYHTSGKPLNTFYGKAQILFNLGFEIRQGEVVVLLGRNGAGKTTTFKSIMGIVPPKSGDIVYKGVSIDKLPPFKTCALGLGYVPEDRRIFSGLTILENLEVGKQPARRGLEAWTPERLFELFPNLAERRNQAGGTLSGGEQQMLTIARTLMGNPEMIILDEPSEGLAPVIVDQLADTIQTLKDEGVVDPAG